jgi:membrane-associated phospholipid phosphatase
MAVEREPGATTSDTLTTDFAALERSPAHRLLARLGPDLTMCIAFSLALLTVGQLFGAHYVLRLSTMLLPGLIAPGIIIVQLAKRARLILNGDVAARRDLWHVSLSTLRDWVPLVVVALVFDNLENYTGLVRKLTIDRSLYDIDVKLFGVEPTVWMMRFYNPILTDWMAACYGIFLVTPMFLGVVVSLRGRSADFRELANAVMWQMWLAFFIFICLPAGPPRYFQPLLDGAFHTRIPPSVLGWNDSLQGRWDTYSPLLVRASFPSLHCAYATLTLVYAWRFGGAVFSSRPRLFFWLVLPLELTLYVSTVYLRHHWIPDCVAGITLALIVCQLAPFVRRRWPGLAPAPAPAAAVVRLRS